MSIGKEDYFFDPSESIDRLKGLLGLSSDTALANRLGKAQNTLSGFRQRQSAPYREIIDIALQEGFAVDYLLTGRGPKFIADIALADQAGAAFVEVPVYDVALSAGGGTFIESATVVRKHGYTAEYMQSMGLRPERCAVFKIDGDSMEPKLHSGDHGLFNLEENVVRPAGGVYAIRLDDSVVVKHVSRVRDSDGQVVQYMLAISSFNELYKATDFRAVFNEYDETFEIIGRLRDHNHRWD